MPTTPNSGKIEYVATNFQRGMNSLTTPTKLNNEEAAYILNMDWNESDQALRPRYGLVNTLPTNLNWDNFHYYWEQSSLTWQLIASYYHDGSAGGFFGPNPISGTMASSWGVSTNLGFGIPNDIYGLPTISSTSRWSFCDFYDYVLAFNDSMSVGSFLAYDKRHPATRMFQVCNVWNLLDRTTWKPAGGVLTNVLKHVKFGVGFGSRLLVASVDYPDVLFVSDSNGDVAIETNPDAGATNHFPYFDWIEVGYDIGDAITGLGVIENDAIVFKNKHIHLVGYGNIVNSFVGVDFPGDIFYSKRLPWEIGCISGYAICAYNGGLIFPGSDGIYYLTKGRNNINFSSNSVRTSPIASSAESGGYVIQRVSDTIKDLKLTSTTGITQLNDDRLISAVIHLNKYIISFVDVNGNNKCYALDLDNFRWVEYDGPYHASAMISIPAEPFVQSTTGANSQPRLIVASKTDNLLYYRDLAATADSTDGTSFAYTKKIRTKAFNIDDYFSLKLFDILKVHVNLLGVDLTLHFRLIFDEDDSQTFGFSVSTNTFVSTTITSTGAIWDDFNWNDASWGVGSYTVDTVTGLASGSMYWDIIEKIDNITAGKRGRSLQVEISSNGATDSYELHQLALEIQNLGRSNMPRFYTFTED